MNFLTVNGVRIPVEEGTAGRTNGREAPATSVAGALLYTRKRPSYELSFTTTLLTSAEQAVITELFSFPTAKSLSVSGTLNDDANSLYEGRIIETRYVTALWRTMKLELRLVFV